TSPSRGWTSNDPGPEVHGFILLCSRCNRPTFLNWRSVHQVFTEQVPAAVIGNPVEHLPADVGALYAEARACTGSRAYTAAVLTCRKILMHVAVEKGAPEGGRFVEYVQFLADQHYISQDSKGWVDYIRKKSNEANHEIELMGREDAENL